MARSFSEESMSDSHKIGETRYRMSHIIPSGTIARTLLLAGILLAVTVLVSQSFFPAFAQQATVPDGTPTMGTEEIDYDETGENPVVVYTAMDPEGENVHWSIVPSGGAANSPDAADFEIANGVLTFKKSPDFENPTDRVGETGNAATDNTYVVQVRASDKATGGITHTITVTVKVQNVNEPGEVEFGHPQPKEGTPISVTLTDDDRAIDSARALLIPNETNLTASASTTWQWYRSESKDGPWGTPIATSTVNPMLNHTRTPEAADVGHYLRATATYFDGQDTDEERTAHGISANKVLMEEYINTAPKFRDDDAVTDGSQIAMSVPEDESLEEGDNVGTPITATDPGEDGTEEVLTYSITGAGFTIDSATGQLKLAAATTLDFEGTTTSYTVTVRATDPSGLFSDVTVTITITAVDEAPTIAGDDEPDQLENTAITTAVATYTGDDDEDTNADLKWSLTGTHRNVFAIPATGATADLTFVSMQNYEALPSSVRTNGYKVTVNVTDSAGNTTSRPVTVKVTNREEDGTVTLSHPEARVGTSITAKLSDDDRPTGVTWSWTQAGSVVSGATRSSFRPTSTGTLTATASYKDGFSSTVMTVTSASYDIVEAVSTSGSATNTAPVVTDPGAPLTVPENEPIGTTVGAPIAATDDDTDDVFLFKLTSGGNWFDIGESTGQLTTKVALDHEQRASYTVTVTATDSSLRSSRGLRVTINVTHVEEDPVIAEGGASLEYPEIKNGKPNTDTVFTYTASDDEDNDVNLEWSVPPDSVFELSNTTGARTTLRFKSPPDFEDGSTNPATVVITVEDSNEDTDTRTVSVRVTNVDEPGMVTGLPAQPKQGVLMEVELVNDPDGPAEGDTGGGDTDTATLTDNASTTWEWHRSRSRTGGWTLITATSTDNVDVNTFTRKPEAADVGHYLRATAKYSDGQGDGKVAHGITARTVQAKEYVNSAPKFRDDVPDVDGEADTQGYQIIMEIPEDNSLKRGDAVGDPIDDLVTDIGQNGSPEILTYTLTLAAGDGAAGGDQTDFSIHRLTGQLSFSDTVGAAATSKLLDYENITDITDRQYVVRVKAIDPAMASSTALVTIKIMPEKEAPEFGEEDEDATPVAENLAATSTAENLATTTVLSAYTASDDEDTTPLKWSLEGADKDRFALCNDDSGDGCTDLTAPGAAAADNDIVTLKFKEVPNFEDPKDSGKNNVYNVIVAATDSDEMKTEKPVIVTVTNEDDPGEVKLSHIQPEAGTRINAQLTDPDGGVSGITWEWIWCEATGTPCTAGATSTINAATRSYTPIAGDATRFLQVTATYTDRTSDSSQDKRTASEISTFAVQPDQPNNQPPVLPDVTQTLKIAENSQKADPVHVVGVVAATSDPPGNALDRLLYTLSGSDAALFTIYSGTAAASPPTGSATSSTAGMIRLKRGTKLDHETKPTYRVTVTVTDPSLASDSIGVTIQVTDVNEPPTVSQRGVTVTGQATVSHPENDTTAVATYRAVGPDAAGARWSLSGPDASAFSIPNGELIFVSPPDFENAADANTDNVYSVSVMVTSGTFDDELGVTVSITNVDEPGTVSITPTTRPRVGTELTAALTDEDGTTSGESWQWARSTSATGPWASISSNGTSATYTPVDGDANNYLRVTASYTDPQGSGKSESATTTATVLGVTATPNDGTVSVSSAQPTVGTAVTARLTDPDGTPVGTVAWQWASSAGSSPGGTWTDISGATSASYTPVAGDVGRYLRARATYTDPVDGPGQIADFITANTVQAATQAIHEYDRNANGRIEISEAIEAVQHYFAGRIRIEVAIQVVQLYFSTLTGD